MGWFESKKGNWCTSDLSSFVTVFETNDGRYKWVSDGMFSDDDFDTIEEAKEDAEKNL